MKRSGGLEAIEKHTFKLRPLWYPYVVMARGRRKQNKISDLDHAITVQDFIFLPDYLSDGGNHLTAFVPEFVVTDLMFMMLIDLGAIRAPTDDEKARLKTEYRMAFFLAPETIQAELTKNFGHVDNPDFSNTRVLDMGKLVDNTYKVPGAAYHCFYKEYYMKGSLSNPQRAYELHREMLRLEKSLL